MTEDAVHSREPQQSAFQLGIVQHGKTARAWCFILLMLSIGRLSWIFLLKDYLTADVSWADFLLAGLQGIRIDSVVATYLLLPVLVIVGLGYRWQAACHLASGFRFVVIALFCLSWPALLFGSIGYFETFGDTFNLRVFDLFNGNISHILDIATKEYGLLWKLPGSLAFSLGLLVCYQRFAARPATIAAWLAEHCSTLRRQVVFGFCFTLLIPVLMRGSVGSRPIMHRDSCVTSQWALNQSVINPYFALRCAWKEHRATLNFEVGQRFLEEQSSHTSVALLADYLSQQATVVPCNSEAGETFHASSKLCADDLSLSHPLLTRVSKGSSNRQPSHIFLLFVESYDAWPFLDKYASLNLVNEGKRLANDGLHFKRFLPGANNSCDSFMITVQGLFETNKYQQQRMPTSLVSIMQQLGYRTRSVNGFGLHTGTGKKICTDQGFEETYFTHDIKPGGETNHNTVHDRTLYEFAEGLSYDEPVFSMIYPQSYHPPFDLDLEAEDCVLPPYPEDLRSPLNHDEEQRRVAYGHLKYTDRCLGEFVDKMSQRLPRALFVITGDHFCRNPIAKDIGIYERSAVPLILYGPEILQGKEVSEQAVGSHGDIACTLTELVAPAGFEYCAIGQDLLSPTSHMTGVGTDYVIYPDSIVCLKGEGDCEPLPWQSPLKPSTLADSLAEEQQILQARQMHCVFHSVGYLLAKKALETGVPERVQIAERPDRQYQSAPATMLR